MGKWDIESIKDLAKKGRIVNMNGADTALEQNAPTVNKFGNKIVTIDGIKFRSKHEAQRYGELKLMKANGFVKDFQMQVTFVLEVNGVYITKYIADFVVHYVDGQKIVEDPKGFETEEFKIKMRLMKALFGIDIVLIRNIKNDKNGKIKNRSRGKSNNRRR